MSRTPATIFEAIKRIQSVFPRSHLGLQLVTEFPGNHFPDGVSCIGVSSVGVISKYPPMFIDHDSTLFFRWFNEDIDGIAIGSYGDFVDSYLADVTSSLSVDSTGEFKTGVLLTLDAVSKLGLKSHGKIWISADRRNWVKWSKIGSLDFTLDKSNIAGERPIELKGLIYSLKKLKDRIVAYGENGVSLLIPKELSYGLSTIYRVGLKGRFAIAGNESIHFFIDTEGRLIQVEDSLTLLDYSEYLSDLDNPILSWDETNSLLYICDGSLGFVYSIRDKSLGEGPINISGIGYQSGDIFYAAPSTIQTPSFKLRTDIYDMGTRKFKTIRSLEVGTDLNEKLEIAIETRLKKDGDFIQIGWFPLGIDGRCHVPCYGLEFRFLLRAASYEYFEIDYIKINGIVHKYSYVENTIQS